MARISTDQPPVLPGALCGAGSCREDLSGAMDRPDDGAPALARGRGAAARHDRDGLAGARAPGLQPADNGGRMGNRLVGRLATWKLRFQRGQAYVSMANQVLTLLILVKVCG